MCLSVVGQDLMSIRYLELAEPLSLEVGGVNDGHLGRAVHVVRRDKVLQQSLSFDPFKAFD